MGQCKFKSLVRVIACSAFTLNGAQAERMKAETQREQRGADIGAEKSWHRFSQLPNINDHQPIPHHLRNEQGHRLAMDLTSVS
jgi:hypothetical protein